jgi:hypothetical protein
MKNRKYIFVVVSFLLSFGCALYVTNAVFDNILFSKKSTSSTNLFDKIQEGDMIFQTSESEQCEAVRIATNSKFSHCGIVFIEKGTKYVLEAVQPVRYTPLSEWITHGKDTKFVTTRLKNASEILTPETIQKMKAYATTLNNKDYDLYFEWSDDKLYCSELVWKIYKNGAGIELCPLKKLSDFNLKNTKVKAILAERYGKKIPLNEDVVAPSDLQKTTTVTTILDTY